MNAEVDQVRRRVARPIVGAGIVAGALIALSLGVYGRYHQPAGRPIFLLGFDSMLDMKAWLASAAAILAVTQIVSAFWMYGKLPWKPGPRVALVHRWTGTVAFVITLPVAYHCLWSLGFQNYTTRVLNHSLLGCVFYGVFTTKMILLRGKGLASWILPLAGGLLFAALIGIWLTSALWYFQQT